MTVQFLDLGTTISLTTPFSALKQIEETGYCSGQYEDDKEYLIVGYSHCPQGNSVVARMDLALPSVIDGPLIDRKPGLYFQSQTFAFVVLSDLKKIQVQVIAASTISISPDFVKIAINREFLPALKDVRHGFSPTGVSLTKRGPKDIIAQLDGYRGMEQVSQTNLSDFPHRSSRVKSKVPFENFMLDVANGPTK